MIEYLPGHEPDFWEPDPGVGSHRFALGSAARASAGAPPLIAIGMNASHPAETQADRTVNRLIEASVRHGYSGWNMLNLYPERSPKPSQLSAYDAGLSALNCAAIEQVLLRNGASEVRGAWGNMPHRTLKRAKLRCAGAARSDGREGVHVGPADEAGEPSAPEPARSAAADAGAEDLLELTTTRALFYACSM